ncbi:unnamed protein product [Lymnaea stagnalis]|uniref:Cysteine sulfinic acid decarboxylase n=1 Tax=Lymnaea stagnalis TaxID=6523 RepID=A0AAV2I0J8_LYMST
MEKAVVDKMLSHIGFRNGDGLFCPGGSLSNMYAMNLARYRMFPNVKLTGVSGLPALCVMTSEKGHYSVKKGAAFLGIGMNNVIAVKTDVKGRMIPEELTRAIEGVKSLGYVPFIVNATAGTTVFGAYDPLSDIADICETYGLWMHVDASWGGSVLLSDKLRDKVNGIGRADSVTWNPHKMMGVPFQAAGFFTRHKDILSECHSAKAKYLFQQDKFYDVSFDTGDKSIQCGRKVDALKLWIMWKAKGSNQFAADIENIFNCANYLAQKLAKTEGFRLVVKEPECTNVCFWYIPPSLRTLDETAEWWDNLSKVAPLIKQRMTEQGTLLIGYQPDGDLVNFFRMVVVNHKVTEQEMDFVISEIERLGKDI